MPLSSLCVSDVMDPKPELVTVEDSDDDSIEILTEDLAWNDLRTVGVSSSEKNRDEINDVPPTSSASESSDCSSEEDQRDYEWRVIKIEDDDDGNELPERAICIHCPSTTEESRGTLKALCHVQRHIFPGHFACQTCHRPFVQMNFCLSHEHRVHGTPLPYHSNNPVLVLAKADVEKRQQKATTSNAHDLTGSETDPEDVKFYKNRFVSSKTLYPYKGPKVIRRMESYEIQVVTSHPKDSRNNKIAQEMIENHKENVKRKWGTSQIGRFLGKKGKKSVSRGRR